jgi:hypothetical protein
MTNTNDFPVQLNFFTQLNRLKVGEVIPVPVSDNEIGGELLNILSKGLYTNPLDAIREYVQNSIDADANEVEIQVTGNSVYILDRGIGMNRTQLLQAREFGVSKKSLEENVGFRGIGIYSGFDLCERLVIRSKTKGEEFEHILEFEFKIMREILEAARNNINRPITPLAKLLSENTYYRYEKSNDPDEAFTLVQLEELGDNHIHRLSDVKEMRDYILRNLPIRFSSDFEYADEIEDSLREYVPGYKSARVILRVEDYDAVVVEKPAIPNLGRPIKSFVYHQKRVIAYYWACLVSGSDAISSRSFEKGTFKDFAGLVYKVKGFTIGDRNYLRRYVTRIYDWWTGEIYVIDTGVVPTSARDDFEAGPSKESLETSVADLLNGSNNKSSLQRIALDAQATRRADKVIKDNEKAIEAIQTQIESGDFDQFKLYADLDKILRVLIQHQKKASNTKFAKELVAKAKNLQKLAKREIDRPTPVAVRKKDAAKTAMQESEESTQNDEQSSQQHDLEGANGSTEGAPDTLDDGDDKNNEVIDGLIQVIERSGWTVESQDIVLLNVISEALMDILGVDSPVYLVLMKDIEERLAELLEEE